MVKAAPPNTSAHFDTTTMVYIFTNATGSKISNFNKFRNTLDVQGFLDDNSTLPWECTGSPFVDKNFSRKVQSTEKTELLIMTKLWYHQLMEKLAISQLRGHSHIESSHNLRQNDAKLQTHPPSTLNVKMPNLPKIDVYNFRYKSNEGIFMKLFFLSHKCINKYVHKLVQKQIYCIASSAHITSMPLVVPTLLNCK